MEKKKRIVINWMAEVKTEFKIKKDLKQKKIQKDIIIHNFAVVIVVVVSRI